jgi:hypothetical protein
MRRSMALPEMAGLEPLMRSVPHRRLYRRRRALLVSTPHRRLYRRALSSHLVEHLHSSTHQPSSHLVCASSAHSSRPCHAHGRWGANGDGQLGLGDTATRFTPYRVRMLAGRALEAPGEASCVQVACGGRHTLVLSAHGEVWSCGCNVHGQLGHGTSFGHSPLYQMKQVSGRWARPRSMAMCA